MAEFTIRISYRLLKVGVALVAGICTVLVVTYLWSSGFFRPKYRLKLYVEEATSLPIGASVRVTTRSQVSIISVISDIKAPDIS
jgi:ABC-type transporter Mla subunit MlaD